MQFSLLGLEMNDTCDSMNFTHLTNLWSPHVIGQTIYIFMLWFVLLSFFPRLISAAADWMSAILPHMVWP